MCVKTTNSRAHDDAGESASSPQAPCLFCRLVYTVRNSTALYAEAFCSKECEIWFVEHVGRYYGKGPVFESRVLAIQPAGNA